jgi:hypothetical protein
MSETIRRAGLAPNTLEINQVRANLYAPSTPPSTSSCI